LFDGLTNDLQVTNTNFTHLLGPHGAGLAVENGSNITIINNTFANNSAENGGGLKLGTIQTAILQNNTFFNNSAIMSPGKPFDLIADSENLRGGALFIDCLKDNFTLCNTSFVLNNTFDSNYAQI